MEIGESECVQSCRLTTRVGPWYQVKTETKDGNAYAEPRNHLSVPSLSESEEIACLYSNSTVCLSICVPYGGRSELRPESGGGGGLSVVSTGRPDEGKGVRRDQALNGSLCERA